ncbi:helix-turn-helix domain-containing protein [Bradyrhizobium sp. CCBAU 53421]|uniref:helix-turn-helix domain-containing protein n=1 Tax=Bradyrhizobium sp. CCBAU 53421 TaxID=1325120 RepID=UPI00188D7CCF|nr:helix-turn-helix transcriptional regulator [Bradyrhizobium sp. CCBAU 53421]QOZ36988.1 XRE family transcriptional regulator [Bradyrhizobium sp. CCBAU 53421]
MDTMERDLAYVAQQVRFLRKMLNLTQESLADMAGLTSRTIEKIESGRHRPEEQTLRSLARALKIELSYFQKPSPEQEARQKEEIRRVLRKTVLVPTDPIRSASDFLNAYGQRDGLRIDTSAVKSDEALEIAAVLVDWIKDLDGVWEDCGMSEQLRFARSFVEECMKLETLGFICHLGSHRQVLREKGRPDLTFNVGLLSIQPKEGAQGRRYALVQLEGRWEATDEDRVSLPEGYTL